MGNIRKTITLLWEWCTILRRSFDNKKVLIISDKNIVSIPISSQLQMLGSIGAVCLLLWLSYSSGKYFAYESILSEKEQELWTTSVDNENLQYQVEDLHRNLSELNKYFDNIRQYDLLAQAQRKSQSAAAVAAAGEDAESAEIDAGDNQDMDLQANNLPQESPQTILLNIREKISERILTLESIIEMTGLKLEQVAANNGNLKKVITDRQEVIPENNGRNNQGGPFVPESGEESDGSSVLRFNREAFENNVAYLQELEKVIRTLPLASPIPRGAYISSHFGKRVDPMRRSIAMHSGVDLVGGYREKVFSPAPGIVRYARPFGAYGRLVEVDHGSGITTRYGHLYKILVKKGDRIERGDLIGVQGNSGRSTGDHLHYEVRYNNTPINPEKFLKAGRYVF